MLASVTWIWRLFGGQWYSEHFFYQPALFSFSGRARLTWIWKLSGGQWYSKHFFFVLALFSFTALDDYILHFLALLNDQTFTDHRSYFGISEDRWAGHWVNMAVQCGYLITQRLSMVQVFGLFPAVIYYLPSRSWCLVLKQIMCSINWLFQSHLI